MLFPFSSRRRHGAHRRPCASSSDSCRCHRRVTLLPPWTRNSESQSRQSLRRCRAVDHHDVTSLHHIADIVLMCLSESPSSPLCLCSGVAGSVP
ncbi:hypothetical protein E2542_SST06793 [Spatholobus suberectus]|nr:hypothetical protein E2542_SST06793 [Spatholobus suberectus]